MPYIKRIYNLVPQILEWSSLSPQALIQCEQLKNEMERQKDRLEKELALQLDKRAGEREAVREEMKKEKENLSSLVFSYLLITLEHKQFWYLVVVF